MTSNCCGSSAPSLLGRAAAVPRHVPREPPLAGPYGCAVRPAGRGILLLHCHQRPLRLWRPLLQRHCPQPTRLLLRHAERVIRSVERPRSALRCDGAEGAGGLCGEYNQAFCLFRFCSCAVVAVWQQPGRWQSMALQLISHRRVTTSENSSLIAVLCAARAG